MRPQARKRFSDRALTAFDAGPASVGLQVRAAADGVPEILIYDGIGADPWGDGVSAKSVIAALADAGDSPVRVRINSPGGDVFEGLAIYNAIRNHAAGADTIVDGIAASAASIIAMAGRTVQMNGASMLMIHNASTLAWGNKADLNQVAGVLGKVDAQLGGVYAAKTGKSAADIAAMMDAETWFSADEAVSGGFANSVLAPPAQPEPASPAGPTAAATQPEDRNRWRRFMDAVSSD